MKLFLTFLISALITLPALANDYAFSAIVEYDHEYYDTEEKVLSLKKDLSGYWSIGFSMSDCEFEQRVVTHNQSFHNFYVSIELDFSNADSDFCKKIYKKNIEEDHHVDVKIIDL